MILGLSKTKYCKGVQCPKMLWLEKYKPEEAEDILPESILATGTMVGDLARGYFGDYALVAFDYDKTIMAAKTKQFMEAGTENIAEAAFLIDGLYCAVDILHKSGEGYDIVEVKSTTKVKDIHIDDMAFQHYVLKRCGVDVKRVFLMHINNTYVRQGELDLQQLFTLEEFTDVVKEKYGEVEENIKSIRAYVDTETEPERDIDLYCGDPYDCAFYKYCSKHVPEPSVFRA